MSLIMGCKLYVDEKATAAAYSLEQARRLALPYIDKRQAIKLEICIASRPTQLWDYDYDTREWVLHN
jgi:hypothetical protein